MYEAARSTPIYRLPELFGGFRRGEYDVLIKYPVAYSPPGVVHRNDTVHAFRLAGLHTGCTEPEAHARQAQAAPWLHTVSISKLIVGDAHTELEFRRDGDSTLVNVVGKRGDLEVYVVY